LRKGCHLGGRTEGRETVAAELPRENTRFADSQGTALNFQGCP